MHCSNVGYMLKNQGLLCLPDWIHLIRNKDGEPLHHWDFKEGVNDHHPRILELGCGNGQLCNFLSMFAYVTGVDITDSPAREKYSDGWTFIEEDITRTSEYPTPIPYHDYDWVISFDVLEHIGEFKVYPLIRKMSRAKNILVKVACSGGRPLHLCVQTEGWWLDVLTTKAPHHNWSVIRNYRRLDRDGNPIFAPLFYGRRDNG